MRFGASYITEEQRKSVLDVLENYVTVTPEFTENKVQDKNVNPFFRNLVISRSPEKLVKRIYTCNKSNAKADSVTYKLYTLYICLSCEFVRRIKYMIFNSIKSVPVFYQTAFLNTEYDHEVENKFGRIKNELDLILSHINQFIFILRTLIYVEPHTISSNETAILHEFYAFKYKIQYFVSLYDNNESIKNTDDIFVYDCLEAINKIQKFLLLNCDTKYYRSNGQKKIKNYDFSKKISDVDSIKQLLGALSISNFTLEDVPTESCTKNETLLKNVVYYNGDDGVKMDISKTIGKAEIALEQINIENFESIESVESSDSIKSEPMTISKLFFSVIDSYDIETIYVYLKSVLNAILVILYNTTESLLLNYKNAVLPESVHASFERIRDQLTTDPGVFPKVMVDYFDYLEWSSKSSVPADKILRHLQNENEYVFRSVNLPNSTIDFSLEQFMKTIIDRQNDLKCFNEHFEILREEYDGHCIPFLLTLNLNRNIRSTPNKSILTKKPENDGDCNYIRSIYLLCVEVVINFNYYYSSMFSEPEKKSFIKSGCDNLSKIFVYFSLTLKSSVPDDILKIANKFSIMFANMQIKHCYHEALSYMDNYLRPTYLIMVELNIYWLEKCASPHRRQSILLHRSININDIGKYNMIEKRICKFLNIKPYTYSTDFDGRHFDLCNLYTKYIEQSRVISEYENVIKYNWKGEEIFFKNLYENATSHITLSSRFLYAFYDFFFKFYIAAFFYEIKNVVLNYLLKQCWDEGGIQIEQVKVYEGYLALFSEDCFPETLRPFTRRLQWFATQIVDSQITIERKNFMLKQFEKVINEHYIVLKTGHRKTRNFTKFEGLEFITNDLSSVKAVFYEYQKIIKPERNQVSINI